ncbi:A-kinase anchor protein 9, partial [Silurus meridionalis]
MIADGLVEAAVDAAPETGLLEETEKLMQEKVDVQRQAQKDHLKLLEQVKQLEAELEEQEQAADREHERDVFQQEIQNLEQQIKSSSKPQADHRENSLKTYVFNLHLNWESVSEPRTLSGRLFQSLGAKRLPLRYPTDVPLIEVEELSVALQEKSDWCSELLLRVEQLQRDVRERDEEIERQEERVRGLEEVLVSHNNRDITPTREDSKQYASMEGGADANLEALLQTEKEALDRKEKEIVNLEEQLEQFRDELQNKSEEVQQLHMQLEIQRKEISTQQQDLQAHSSLHM